MSLKLPVSLRDDGFTLLVVCMILAMPLCQRGNAVLFTIPLIWALGIWLILALIYVFTKPARRLTLLISAVVLALALGAMIRAFDDRARSDRNDAARLPSMLIDHRNRVGVFPDRLDDAHADAGSIAQRLNATYRVSHGKGEAFLEFVNTFSLTRRHRLDFSSGRWLDVQRD